MSNEEMKPAPSGRVIEGSVGAEAKPAEIGVNKPLIYAVREVVHHRLHVHPQTREELRRDTMIENEVMVGARPDGEYRFHGLGTLRADIRAAPGQPSQPHVENYRFPVGGETLEEAWDGFEEWAERGAEIAKADFRKRYAEFEERMRKQLLVPGGLQQPGLVGPGGTPLGGQ